MRMNEYMFIRTYISSKSHGTIVKFVKHKHNREEKYEREFWRECKVLRFKKQRMKKVRGMSPYMNAR